MGVTAHEDVSLTSLGPLEGLLGLLGNGIGRLVERAEFERQLSHLNAYLTVSSTLAQSLGLHELMEIALYCCMEVVSAEKDAPAGIKAAHAAGMQVLGIAATHCREELECVVVVDRLSALRILVEKADRLLVQIDAS